MQTCDRAYGLYCFVLLAIAGAISTVVVMAEETNSAPWVVTITPTQASYTNINDVKLWYAVRNISTNAMNLSLPPEDRFATRDVQIIYNGTNLSRRYCDWDSAYPSVSVAPQGVVSSQVPLRVYYTNTIAVGIGSYQVIWRSDWAGWDRAHSINYTNSFVVTNAP